MRADDVEIGRACPIDLRERLATADAEFHCDHCDRTVHVLSHMSEDAAARVLARRQRDDLCVAYLRARDGDVHFRREGETLVPASRLGGPRMMLRASALALTMAACSNDEGSIERVDLDSFEQPSVTAPPVTVPISVTTPPEEYVVHAGAPPLLDEFDVPIEKEPCDPQVKFQALEPLDTPEPTLQQLARTAAGRKGGTAILELRYCVDEQGKVVDAERVRGDEQLARLYIKHMARWRFAPYKIDGRKTRVCTTQYFRVSFEPSPA
jgi:hypothetical protein